eukprot:jgi/Astpho2/3823/e_gw1.00062.174.1_t
MRASQEAFQAFNHGDKGYLDKHGVKCALLALTGRLPCKACSTRCRAYCKAAEARLSCRHSLIMPRQASNHYVGAAAAQLLRHTFKAFDIHGQGFITRQTFHEVMKAAAPFTAEIIIDQVFEAADTDSNGLVSFREFASLMQEADQLR